MAENLTRNLTTLLESARDMTLEAASLASSNLMQEQSGINLNISQQELSKLLDSRSDKEKLIGLKTLMTFMSLNLRDENQLLAFFPEVIKNVTSSNQTIKKLVFIYLLRFNHLSPDTALLSINAIQKATLDKNPVLRSLAIRTLSGIQIPAIIPILVISIQKCINDSSPLVRASTAVAITKCFKLEFQFNGEDSPVLRQLVGFVKDLLADSDSKVLNSAVITFGQILSKNLDLLHPYFHHLTSKLPELESWAQSSLIDILTEYCKLYCSKPIDDDESDTLTFLNSLRPLLYSQSAHVILALSKAYINLGTSELLKENKIHLSLLKFLKRNDQYCTYMVLQQILIISKIDASIFGDHINIFFLYPLDSIKVSSMKLKILSNLIGATNYTKALRELKYYVNNSLSLDVKLEALRAISIVITRLSDIELNNKILKWCFLQINKEQTDDKLIDETLVCIRYIMSQNPQAHVETLLQLASQLLFSSNTFNSSSKASIVWLLGEFLNLNLIRSDEYIPDILRVLITQNFYHYETKSERVRLEILNLSAKSWCKELYQWKVANETLLRNDISTNDTLHQALAQMVDDSKLLKLYSYCLYLCRFDESLDIRNEARKFSALLPSVDLNNLDNFDQEEFLVKLTSNIDLAALILQSEKPTPVFDKEATFTLADIIRYDQSLNTFLKYYNLTENWSEKPTRNEIRTTDLKIKNFDIAANSVSSKQMHKHSTNKGRFNGFGNQDFASERISEFNRARTPETTASSATNGKKYQLQSLDEFFRSESEEEDEEEAESSEESESEEDEDEEEEEEEEESSSGQEAKHNGDVDSGDYKAESDTNEHDRMI